MYDAARPHAVLCAFVCDGKISFTVEAWFLCVFNYLCNFVFAVHNGEVLRLGVRVFYSHILLLDKNSLL